jgi:hypothetical protein
MKGYATRNMLIEYQIYRFNWKGSSTCLINEANITEKGLRKLCRANGIKPKTAWRKKELIQALMKI